ncbi:MAG TPA: L,D-transpeptidase [Candidatus Acidoferrales bacterium]|nr:L,D-transpeptidase [Candidatus Acidoferrales bacterium]
MRQANERTTNRRVRNVLVLLVAPVLAAPTFAQEQARPATQGGRLVLVSIPDRKLAVIESEKVVARFPVAVGSVASPSPIGKFRIVSRVSNPTYYRPGTVIPTGKDNPVGTRWVGISQKGYGIHGTNAPKSVGHAASHGCIRLRNRDMERLFAMVRVGDAVEIRDERDEQVAQIFGDSTDDAAVASAETAAAAGGQ